MKKSKTVRAKNLVDIELEKVHAVKIENIVNLVGDFPRIEKVELVTTPPQRHYVFKQMFMFYFNTNNNNNRITKIINAWRAIPQTQNYPRVLLLILLRLFTFSGTWCVAFQVLVVYKNKHKVLKQGNARIFTRLLNYKKNGYLDTFIGFFANNRGKSPYYSYH